MNTAFNRVEMLNGLKPIETTLIQFAPDANWRRPPASRASTLSRRGFRINMKRTECHEVVCRDGRIRAIPRARTQTEIVEVFWSKVSKAGADECWLWQGKQKADGYGLFWNGKTDVKAHRFSYELHNSVKLKSSILVCHKCDVRLCVNPSHFFTGRHLENNRDACNKGRNARGETSPLHKLTELEVLTIRSLRKRRVPIKQLAVQFGVVESNIEAVIYRRSWKHLPDIEPSEYKPASKKNIELGTDFSKPLTMN